MSQLHERLEQLVHYSSQLIFVSGDSASIQQRTLSDFLASQADSTEVSFFAASDDQSSSDYRRIICRQLANHTVGSFVRPLRELLADLDGSKGQYLVCISKADAMDMAFLNELWEWVTTSRSQNEALHVNVILFASSQWSEKAQTWLPEHQTNKPVLLSSQSIDPVGFDVSALENLMAQKRAFFANESRHTIVRKKWFIFAVLGVFLLIFFALMSVQYPEQVKSLLLEGQLTSSTESAPSVIKEQGMEDRHGDALTADSPASSEASEDVYESPLEVVDASSTDGMFASDWIQDAPIANGQSQANASLETTNETLVLADKSDTAQTDEVPNQTQDNNLQDFAVEDITSVQDLNDRLEESLDEQRSQQNDENQAQTPEQNDSISDNAEQTPFEFDEAMLLAMPANQISIQLSGIQNRGVLTQYINDNGLADQVWIYQTQRYGGPWYVVLFAQRYDSIPLASEAIATLPQNLRSGGAFAKSLAQIQAEIRQQ